MIDLRPFGWAPGGYYVLHCKRCDEEIWQCDKRALHCQACAMTLYLAHRETVEAPLICDYDENSGRIGL